MDEPTEKTVLWFDSAQGVAGSLEEYLGLKTEVVNRLDMLHAMAAQRYPVLVVEPFRFYGRPAQLASLRGLMASIVDYGRMPIVVYTTIEEQLLDEEYSICQGQHYNFYVYKHAMGGVEQMARILNSISPGLVDMSLLD